MNSKSGVLGVLVSVFFLGLLPAAEATSYCGNQDHGIWLVQQRRSGYGSQAAVKKYNHGLVSCGVPVRLSTMFKPASSA
jgi:hypothetical protein